MTATETERRGATLGSDEAATYAQWFASLADPTRVRALYTVATAPGGSMRVGELTQHLGISQSTCSHHVSKLAEIGFVRVTKTGTSSIVSVNQECCTGLPHAADVVMGTLQERPCCPADLPEDVTVRAMSDADWEDVVRIYGEGIATDQATFETEVPNAAELDAKWLTAHRWVAEIDGTMAGWAAVTPVSARACYSGVGESSVYVADQYRSRGVGKSLLYHQVNAADEAGLWTLQASVFPENRASVALYHSAGFRTLGIRERIAQVNGQWRDTVFLERRRTDTEL